VRIGCSVAQGLALGADLPVLPVPTLAALAQGVFRHRGWRSVLSCLDARMREIYLAAYVRDAEAWREVAAPAVLPPEDARLPAGANGGGWSGAGNGFVAYPTLAARLALTQLDASARPTAQAVGELALPRFRAGEGVAAAAALPLYVRHRVALTTAERESGLKL
jgi:tRNA threonylcarbamoyladenosine biosynthesis protein TsaB